MSRAALAKSRADKGKPTSSAAPAVAHEIIQGKYNDQDWNFMVDHDEGDEFITDIVEDACSSAMGIIFQNYIQHQLIPYTVMQAKDAILQIIEWQFLSRDEGEAKVETDPGWMEDEEPAPAKTDCWAQGSVPKIPMTNMASVMEEDSVAAAADEVAQDEEPEQLGVQDKSIKEKEGLTGSLPQEDEEECTTSIAIEETDLGEEESGQEQITKDQTMLQKKRKEKFKPHRGKLKSPGIGNVTESLDSTEMKLLTSQIPASPGPSPDPALLTMPSSCHSILKLQAGRPPGTRDFKFDEGGNVICATKLDPSRLPSHKVRTGYHVVDPRVEAAQARLEAMRTGKRLPKPPTAPNTSGRHSSTQTGRTYMITATVEANHASHTRSAHSGEDSSQLPPPLIELMEVAPGVIVKERDRMKKGPKQHWRKTDLMVAASQRGLRPIHLHAAVPSIAVAEVLEHQTPIIRPLVDTVPVPPIRQTSVSSQ